MKKANTLKHVSDESFLTVEEAAQTLGIKTNAIRNYLYLGKLTTHKFKTLTLIGVDEIEGWKEKKRN